MPLEPTEAAVLRAALEVASRELIIRRAGVSRVEGYAALRRLEDFGLVALDESRGVRVTYGGRMVVVGGQQ